jgi:hypothetical protein
MPIFLTQDPQLNVALKGLADAMFPDPATEMMAAYRRAGTMKVLQEGADLRTAAEGRNRLYDMMGSQAFNVADPNNQRLMYREMLLGGPDTMKQAPGFLTAFTGAGAPGIDQGYLAQMQTSSGVQPYGGTRPGFELGQRTELGKAGIMAGAHVRGAQIAANQRQREFEMSPFKLGENDVGIVPLAGQAMFGGKEVIVPPAGAALGAGGGLPTYKGTGVEQQDTNIVMSYNAMKNRGMAIPQDLELAYAIAFTRLYGPKTERRTDDRGNIVEIPVSVPVPPGVIPPNQTALAAVAAQQPAAEPVMGGAGAPEAAVAPVAPPAPQTGPQAAVAPPGSASGVKTLVPGNPQNKGLPEHQSRNLFFLDRMRLGHQEMARVLGNQAPSLAGFALAAPKEGLWSTLATNALAPDSAKQFMTGAQQFMSAVLRKDTGAAAPFHEYPQYWVQFIPMPGDSQALLAQKAQARAVAMQSIERGLPPEMVMASAQSIAGSPQVSPAVMEQMMALSRSMSSGADSRSAADALVGFGR